MSPLLAAIYLKPLDDAMDKAQIAYVRYMDDWLSLTTNRHKRRQGIALVNQVLNQLKVHQHHIVFPTVVTNVIVASNVNIFSS